MDMKEICSASQRFQGRFPTLWSKDASVCCTGVGLFFKSRPRRRLIVMKRTCCLNALVTSSLTLSKSSLKQWRSVARSVACWNSGLRERDSSAVKVLVQGPLLCSHGFLFSADRKDIPVPLPSPLSGSGLLKLLVKSPDQRPPLAGLVLLVNGFRQDNSYFCLSSNIIYLHFGYVGPKLTAVFVTLFS